MKKITILLITVLALTLLFADSDTESIVICFNADILGNTRGDFSIEIIDDIVRTPFNWFNALATEFQITNLERLYRVKNTDWHLDGKYPMNIFRVKTNNNNRTSELKDQLKNHEHILFADYEPTYEYSSLPNDPFLEHQWVLDVIQAKQAWEINTGSPEVIIGVVDSGIKWNHPDIRDNMWINEAELPGITINWETGVILGGDGLDNDGNGFIDDVMGWDFFATPVGGERNNPFQNYYGNSHGTSVAGAAAAVGNNGQGVAGIAYNAKILSTKHSPYNLLTNSILNAYAGIYYLVDTGAHIINCSWGGTAGEELSNLAVAYATQHDVLVVAGVGNNNRQTIQYPAASPGTFAVAATDQKDEKAFFSNYGDWIDISAPGFDVYTPSFNTDGENTYTYAPGTSFASPIVAGVAALIKSNNPSLSVNEVKNILLSGADHIDHLNQQQYSGLLGAGRVNAYNSLLLPTPVNYDLIAKTISGNRSLRNNVPATFAISVQNIGMHTANNFTVNLMMVGNNTPLASVSGQSLTSGQTETFSLTFTPDINGEATVFGQVIFANDENITNNTTSNYKLYVLPQNVLTPYVGNPNSTNYSTSIFIGYEYEYHISQNIFLQEELEFGTIYQIDVGYRVSGTLNSPGITIRIYLASTNISSFPGINGWVPYDQFTLVYEGELSFGGSIVLDTPFVYTQDNLVIMATKIASGRSSSRNDFMFTITPTNRSINSRGTHPYHPNPIHLDIDPYPQPHWANDEHINAKFYIVPLETVQITGSVFDANTNEGIDGVNISLSGSYNITDITTDIDGYFTIPNVYNNRIYTLTVKKPNYQEFVVSHLSVQNSNINLEPILLTGFAEPPQNITAMNFKDIHVELNWDIDNYFGVNIFRSSVSNIEIEDNWDVLVTNYPETEYIDTSWTDLPADEYKYILQAVYADNITSDKVFSNLVSRGIFPSPTNLKAEFVDNSVLLTWQEPILGDGSGVYFSYTSLPYAPKGSYFLVPVPLIGARYSVEILHELGIAGGLLTKVGYAPYSRNQAAPIVINVYIGGVWQSVENNFTFIHRQNVPNNAWVNRYWNDIELTTPIRIPTDEEMWILFENGHNHWHGYDDGSGLEGLSYISDQRSGGYGWVTRPNYTLMVRGFAENVDLELSRSSNPNLHTRVSSPTRSADKELSHYIVYRDGIPISDNITTNYFVDNEVNGSSFMYYVKAVYVNPDGESKPSNMVEISVRKPPKNITAVLDEYKVFLSWEPPDNIDPKYFLGYNVYRNFSLLNSSPIAITNFLDISAIPDYDNIYNVSAVYYVGESEAISTNIKTPVSDNNSNILPLTTMLHTNYPNPFNPETNISFSVKEPSVVSIEIFNIRGQKVRQLINGHYESGFYEVIWDGTDNWNNSVSSGVYFYRMQAGEYKDVKRMVLMK